MTNGNVSEGVDCKFQRYLQRKRAQERKPSSRCVRCGWTDRHWRQCPLPFNPDLPYKGSKPGKGGHGKWKNGGINAAHRTNGHGETEYAYVGQRPYADYDDRGMGVRRNDSTPTADRCPGLYPISEKEPGTEPCPSTDSWGKYYADPNNQRMYMVSETDGRQIPHRRRLQVEADECHILFA